MNISAIIIAREGSKRLPHKNLLNLCGKPMFQWNLEKALTLFKEVCVSSDSSFILRKSAEMGAVAIKRPSKLALDNVPNIPVFLHALQYMSSPDMIVSIQSNSPTLSVDKIKTALRIMEMETVQELTTVDKNLKVHGSVWALKRGRLENYGDPYEYKAEIFLFDDSIDIHTKEDFDAAKEYLEKHVNI